MIIRVPLPHQGIQYERSASLEEVAQVAIAEWHQEIREAALPRVSGGLQPIPRAHLTLGLCYLPRGEDDRYRPQSLGEAHRLVAHAIRGLIQADVLTGNAGKSATRETLASATVMWCVHTWPEWAEPASHQGEHIWIQVEE